MMKVVQFVIFEGEAFKQKSIAIVVTFWKKSHIISLLGDFLHNKIKFKDDMSFKGCFFQFQGPLKDSNEFKLVSEQGIKGSCPTYSVRKNVTQEIQSQAKYLDLEAVCQRYASKY